MEGSGCEAIRTRLIMGGEILETTTMIARF